MWSAIQIPFILIKSYSLTKIKIVFSLTDSIYIFAVSELEILCLGVFLQLSNLFIISVLRLKNNYNIAKVI